jgi:hypothetical protein
MDFMGLINDTVFSREAVVRRKAARTARRQQFFSKIGTALGKDAASGWNMPVDPEAAHAGVPLGAQHPGAAALLIVREALSEYTIPTKVDLEFKRLRRVSGHGPYAMDEGEVWVAATLHSMSGPMHYIEIPVMVHRGRLLSPSVLVHQGNPRVITQNTLDDIIGMGEFKATVPSRKNMYAPPPVEAQAPREVPRVHPGMYHVPPSRGLIASAITGIHKESASPYIVSDDELIRKLFHEANELRSRSEQIRRIPDISQRDINVADNLEADARDKESYADALARRLKGKQAFYEPRVTWEMEGATNVTGAEVPGADGSHIDVGEREAGGFYPSQKVKTNREVFVQDRGGVAWRIPTGEQGVVIRDVDGARRAYYVRFTDLGYAATVAAAALRG